MEAGRVIADNPERHRFELRDGGEALGFVEYRRRPGLIALVHTEMDPAHEGEGLAGDLVRAVLDGARGEELAVLPFCPFVNGWIARHREYVDLVPERYRDQFDLE